MTPLTLLRLFDIRRTQSHKATMAAGRRAVDVSQKPSFIPNHWRPSYQERLQGPNKRRLHKSQVTLLSTKPEDDSKKTSALYDLYQNPF